LICVQATLSVMLFRANLCQDCIDDEGLVGFDRWLLDTLPWFAYALYGLAACGLVLLCVLFVARLRRSGDNTAVGVLAVCVGLVCLALGIASMFWLSSDTVLPVLNSVGLIVVAALFDLLLGSLAVRLYGRLQNQNR